MKKTLVILFITLFTVTSYSQESEFTKMMREMYKSEFVDVVNENMNLNETQNAAFQPIFTDFLTELGTVMDAKLASQAKFADYFETMTDEQVNTLFKEIWSNSKSYDKMLKKYSKKISKAIGPQSAFRFFLIVGKIESNIEFSVIQNIPLVNN